MLLKHLSTTLKSHTDHRCTDHTVSFSPRSVQTSSSFIAPCRCIRASALCVPKLLVCSDPWRATFRFQRRLNQTCSAASRHSIPPHPDAASSSAPPSSGPISTHPQARSAASRGQIVHATTATADFGAGSKFPHSAPPAARPTHVLVRRVIAGHLPPLHLRWQLRRRAARARASPERYRVRSPSSYPARSQANKGGCAHM